ncbi:hypothetical protein [Streptomyces sp. NPDC056061]|uniref:hypothetical protein n=1 Tax=Streptomyces sp. NPDC056061 TaxID=3345700 RepID=UPI0035DBFC5A
MREIRDPAAIRRVGEEVAVHPVRCPIGARNEEGPALDAPDRAARWGGEAAFGVFEGEVGERAGWLVAGQLVGNGAEVVGDGAGGAGELGCDLVVVRGVQARVAAPGEDGFGQAFMGAADEGEFGFDASVGVVQDGVGAGACGRHWCGPVRVVGARRGV